MVDKHMIESTMYGSISVLNLPEDLIIRSLREHGEWGATETALLALLVDDGQVFWDIGACLGTFSLGLAKYITFGRILAVDASESIFDCLDSNLKENLSCLVDVLTVGVGAQDGWVKPSSTLSVDNFGAQEYLELNEKELGAVTCLRLQTLRKTYGNYDVLKLDIEGMEYDALCGDTTYLKDQKPTIWAECNEDYRSLKLYSAMCWLGYEPIYVAFPAFREKNYKGSKNLIYPMVYEAALVAAHPSIINRLLDGINSNDIICRRVKTVFELRKAMFDTPRWVNSEWINLNRAELIARLGREVNSEKLIDFLPPQDV